MQKLWYWLLPVLLVSSWCAKIPNGFTKQSYFFNYVCYLSRMDPCCFYSCWLTCVWWKLSLHLQRWTSAEVCQKDCKFFLSQYSCMFMFLFGIQELVKRNCVLNKSVLIGIRSWHILSDSFLKLSDNNLLCAMSKKVSIMSTTLFQGV